MCFISIIKTQHVDMNQAHFFFFSGTRQHMTRCHRGIRKYYLSADNGLLRRADVFDKDCMLAVGLEGC